jgi:hypothetical protein
MSALVERIINPPIKPTSPRWSIIARPDPEGMDHQ